MSPNTCAVTFYPSKDLRDRIKSTAERNKVSMSQAIIIALENGCVDQAKPATDKK